jgi:tRNA (guanine-N7-)-methyltransferase
MTVDKKFFRRVRSFVRRDGRMTDSQKHALDNLWPKVGLKLEDGLVEYSRVFQREAPRVLEIGFGSGMSLLAMAKEHPEKDFIGIETYRPGIGSLILGMSLQQVSNIRIFYADAVEVLEKCIPEKSLDVVQIFFPDPWPKRRHHKRRLIQPAFVSLVASRLKPQGTLHLSSNEFVNLIGEGQYSNRSTHRPVITKFEARGHESGRQIWELQFGRL